MWNFKSSIAPADVFAVDPEIVADECSGKIIPLTPY
jgi:hypothetical protein